MITVSLEPQDLLNARFAPQPALAMSLALRELLTQPKFGGHPYWVDACRAHLTLDMAKHLAVAIRPKYIADFMAPPPLAYDDGFDRQLEKIRSWSHEDLVTELQRANTSDILPQPESRFIAHRALEAPDVYLSTLCDMLYLIWKNVFRLIWRPIFEQIKNEIARNVEMSMAVGLTHALRLLGNKINASISELSLVLPKPISYNIQSGGHGVLLSPMPILTSGPIVSFSEKYPINLVYPIPFIAEGVCSMEDEMVPVTGILGRTRMKLLLRLAEPTTTKDLAAHLNVTSSAVSQHIGILKKEGLIHSHREGQFMMHELSDLGRRLTAAVSQPQQFH